MNPLTITLEHRYLQAAATFASMDASRYVLNGVLLQVLSGTSSRNIILTACRILPSRPSEPAEPPRDIESVSNPLNPEPQPTT